MKILTYRPTTWWSIENAVAWLATHLPGMKSEETDDPYEIIEVDDYDYFTASAFVWSLLQEGTIEAHAAIDGAPVSAVSAAYWSSVSFIPCWEDFGLDVDPIPNILVLSNTPIRAAGLTDHSEPAGAFVPAAGDNGSEPGFHRVTRDVKLRRDSVMEVWRTLVEETKSSAKPEKKKRAVRDLAKLVHRTLPSMMHKNKSLKSGPQGLKLTKIAEMLMNRWDDEGTLPEVELGAVAKSVGRYYQRLADS